METSKQPIPIILDTDIGGDIDDVLALAFALNSPELEVVGVTTVNTDPFMRARIAAKMLKAFDRSSVPVGIGKKGKFDGSETRCKDINGAVVLDLDDPIPAGDGVDLIIQKVNERPGEITIVGIGPWTNIAEAFRQNRELEKNVKQLVLMGGQIGLPGSESNIICDPLAARYVLGLSVKKTLVPLDVTRLTRYKYERHCDLAKVASKRSLLVKDLIRAWQIGRCKGDEKAEPILHDPLAVAVVFNQHIITKQEAMCICVDISVGETMPIPMRLDEDGSTANVAMGIDVEMFENIFAERIAI